MSTWGELIDAGYARVLGVTVEGIPYAFLETRLLTTGDVDISVPVDYVSARGALRVRESDQVSRELDRVTGLGRGRALDLVFALDALGSVATELFRQPSLKARLTADVNGTATTFPVDDTTGFGGYFYIGREFCTYSGTTSTTFTGVTRAVGGWPHYHPSSSASGYRFCTDRPQYWRGRLVTLYEHLVGPDGRALSSVACSVGSYCRELWKGYVDAQPQVDGRQMVLRCLPIERLLAQKMGGSAKGEVIYQPAEGENGSTQNEFGILPVILTPGDSIFVENVTSGASFTFAPASAGPVMTTAPQLALSLLAATQNAFSAVWDSGAWSVFENDPLGINMVLRIVLLNGGTRNKLAMRSDAWFLRDRDALTFEPRFGPVRTGDVLQFSFDPNQAENGWLIIKPELEADGEPITFPSSGMMTLENDEGLELVSYDDTLTGPDTAQRLVAVRLSGRALMGTTRINPYLAATRATTVPGMRGTLAEVIRTMATSSGTGERGVYDTLAYGLGLAVPDDWFDLGIYPLTSQYVDGASDDVASVENVVGGWLGLMGRCLTQRRGADGYVRIVAASTSLDVPGLALDVTPADILIGGTQTERLFESPNVVRIEDSLRQRRTVTVIRDVPRQQAEGARTVSYIAPGINTASALILGGKALALSDGQLAVTLAVRPGLELQVGDPCTLSLSHPAVWSWADGAVASTVQARVIGESESLGTGQRSLTFLVPAQQVIARQLCPAARVDGYLSTTVLQVDDTTGFAAGMVIAIYRRGDDQAVRTTRTISAVDETFKTVTVTTAVNSVIFPADGDTWFTFADFGSATVVQRVHLYVSATGRFEA